MKSVVMVMSEIDLNNGYVRIANRLLEVIYSSSFNATQLKILMMVMRYTYGFNRKSHSLSITFMAKGTGMSKRYISKELGKLIDGKVINVISSHTTTESREISINKDYKTWIGYGTIVPQVNNSSTVEEEFHRGDEQSFHSPDEQLFQQDKTNIKTNINTGDSHTHDLFERVWKEYPNKKGKGAVSKKTKKKLDEIGEENILKAIRKYKKYCDENQSWYTPMFGSTFFNTGIHDYLPTEESEKPKKQPREIKVLTDTDQEELVKRMEAERQQKVEERRKKRMGV